MSIEFREVDGELRSSAHAAVEAVRELAQQKSNAYLNARLREISGGDAMKTYLNLLTVDANLISSAVDHKNNPDKDWDDKEKKTLGLYGYTATQAMEGENALQSLPEVIAFCKIASERLVLKKRK